MKKLKLFALSLIVGLISSNGFSQSYLIKSSENTKLSQLFSKNNIMTSVKLWDLGELDGIDKYKVMFQAIEVTDNNSTEQTKGVKVTVYDDNKRTEAQLSSLFYFGELVTYIDTDEYESIMNSLNYMINTGSLWSKEKMDNGAVSHRTKDNFVFGFEQDGKKQIAVMKVNFERAEFTCKLKKANKSFEAMKEIFQIASKELYIKENMDKFKQAEKDEELRQKEIEKAQKENEKNKKEEKDDQPQNEDEL